MGSMHVCVPVCTVQKQLKEQLNEKKILLEWRAISTKEYQSEIN